jgi:molybdopterin-guanine dinucleotide biosynthesis protein A
MGTEKASLSFEGQTLLERTLATAKSQLSEVFLSVSYQESRNFSLPLIHDQTPDAGPLGALESAFATHSDSSWLVIACDLPLLDEKTLSFLLEKADPSRKASCYRNRLDGRAEPLCTLYQPSAREDLRSYLADDRRCVRKFLESLNPQTFELPSPLALDNANRPEHLAELQLLARDGLHEKEIAIEYYGKLSSEVPNQQETRRTTAATLAGLYEEVRLIHRLSLDLDTVKPVLNDEFVTWLTQLQPDSKVAFLPPFAGG